MYVSTFLLVADAPGSLGGIHAVDRGEHGCAINVAAVHAGRALELGRELLHKWGYKRVDELIWVKTNSLRRLIVTGRTGHWLNHSKEHCLVGYKGRPAINRCVSLITFYNNAHVDRCARWSPVAWASMGIGCGY